MLSDGYLKIHTKYRKIQIIGLGTGVQSRNFIEIADFRDLQFRQNKKYDELWSRFR